MTDERGPDAAPTANTEQQPSGGANFDPTPYLRQLRIGGGKQDYLDVKWRLLWLRREHPDAEIITDLVRLDENMAIFKATVTLPSGGKSTGYGSETAGDWGDFIEKAETKAIGRALNALGYGAQFADNEDDPTAQKQAAATSAPKPVATPAATARPSVPPPTAELSPPTPLEDVRQSAPEPAPPIDLAANRSRSSATPPDEPREAPSKPRTATPSAAPAAAKATDEGDVDMADYSWTAFWKWARPLGYSGKGAVEKLLGRDITGLSPAEVRDLVRQASGTE